MKDVHQKAASPGIDKTVQVHRDKPYVDSQFQVALKEALKPQ